MIKKFLSKYVLEVIPSIVATVVGAYIVTHYINSKPEAEKPPAAVSAPAQAATTPEQAKNIEVKAADVKADAKKPDAAKETVKDTAKAEAKAEPKSEPAKAAVKAASRSSGKAEDKAEETASRHRPPVREAAKDEAREKPAVRAPAEASREAEGRDANELARDALARLRGTTEPLKAEQAKHEQAKADERKPDVARTSEPPRAQEAERPQHERAAVRVIYSPASNSAPAQSQIPAARQEAAVPPMGPPVTITPSPQLPSYASDQGARLDDPSRPTPPADIPLGARERGPASVAEEVVSAAKSVFEAVVPR